MDKNILEKDIQRAICEYLETQKFFFWRSNNVPVFAKSGDGVRRFRAMPKYTPRGVPDILMLEQGMFIGFEVKRPSLKGGNPETTEAQAIFGGKMKGNGGSYHVVTSVAAVQAIVDPLIRNRLQA